MELILMTLGTSIDKMFYGFDMAIYKIFGAMQNSVCTFIAKFFTALGDQNFIVGIAVLALVLCFFKKTKKYGIAMLFAIVVGTLLTNVIIKPAVLRIRPYNTLQQNAEYFAWYLGAGALSEGDYSFPSGHTTGAFEMATALFLVFRSDKKKIAWLFPAIALCVAGSRIYLMVHYPTDVIAGILVGIISGVAGYFIMKAFDKINSKVDLGNTKMFKWTNGKAGALAITAIVLAIFCGSYIPALTEGGESAVRCAYNEEYDCYNEAKLDDEKYPAIDGERYCKIHWKQLSGVEE